MPAPKRSIGIAVVGSGRIGTSRARLAAQHAGVGFIAVADADEGRAERLAARIGADLWSGDTNEIVSHPDVDAVIVSTPEGAHLEPTLAALRAGRRTLVEKPLALTLDDAHALVAAANEHGVELRVGYSMRYARRYAVGKDLVARGHIGTIVGGLARTYDTRAVGLAILARSPDATPVMDILTYLVDIVCWYHDAHPVEVVARSHGEVLRGLGHDVDDVVWALLTFDDGSVFDLGTSYALPAGYPTAGLSTRIELVGTEGVYLITEDHGDQILYTESGWENPYAEQPLNLVFLGSRTTGDWALDAMFGRLADETRAWLDHLTAGGPCHITTAAEARLTLEVTLAIDEAARTGRPVVLGEKEG